MLDIRPPRQSFSPSAIDDRHYRKLVNAMTDYAIYGLDRLGRITDWNSGAQRIKGYRAEDIIGQHFSRFYTPEDQAKGEPQRALAVAAREGRFEGEGWRVRSDGGRFWADVVIENILDDQNVPIGYVKVTRDATERRNTQQTLEAFTHKLELALDDRTLALKQRDIFLQEVYHRVKNNLQTIDGIIALQIRKVENLEAKAILCNLRGRIFALGLVHTQLMESSNLSTFDIAPFLRKLSTNLVDGAAGPGVSVSVHAIPLEVGLDVAVPVALLATELVTNALKHAFPEGDGRIEVTLDHDEDAALRLVIADDGQGMPPSMDVAPNRPGLGHEIVRNLMKQLRGTMVMDSGEGTRIQITLPRPVPA